MLYTFYSPRKQYGQSDQFSLFNMRKEIGKSEEFIGARGKYIIHNGWGKMFQERIVYSVLSMLSKAVQLN